MKALAFAGRNRKEILRDPLTLLLGVVMPVAMLWLFSSLEGIMPLDLFTIEKLTPGMIVFSFSFITLFSGMLLGRDKTTSFLMRIFASPMKASEYLIGYAIPLLPVALFQVLVCYGAGVLLGFPVDIHALTGFGVLLIISLLYIGSGLALGTYFTDRQVGGIFAIFVNITTWLSGIWFSPSMIGGAFEQAANLLPFVHAVDAARAAFTGGFTQLLEPLLWVIGYTIVIFGLAIVGFRKKMKGSK
ncbi:ABC transporter permease [Planococcus ruber]|uniref:ABC transporter permease n=1 Tax=Planococcus ruber TaxID=2027871 RepID=UPI001FEFDA20|nr:ABC transporter permease [Planococcus ruber]MCJ1910093.1 ABC transporter permease [Planococcus ruber]